MADPVTTTAAVAFGAKEIILGLGTAVISLLQYINRRQINDLKAENKRIEAKFDKAIEKVEEDAKDEQEKSRQHFMKIYNKLEEIQISIALLAPRPS